MLDAGRGARHDLVYLLRAGYCVLGAAALGGALLDALKTTVAHAKEEHEVDRPGPEAAPGEGGTRG